MGGASEAQLPELRADLQVAHAAETSGFVVFDPPRLRYVRIDDATARMLAMWPRCRTEQDLAAAAAAAGLNATRAQISGLSSFLVANQLAVPRDPGTWKRLATLEKRTRGSWLMWLVHNYLFVRVPLVNPQRWLARWTPRLAFMFTRTAAMLVVAAGLAGLYFAMRQWDAFRATFTDFLSVEGALAFALAMVAVKSLHELGHAVTATRYGCRVPSMGICLIVMAPMLYTDVSDAWKLASWRQRLAIDAAGLVVELGIGCVALFLWAFLPEGMARGVAFVLATTSLLLSVVLNLNPLMRFDGYYILSDLTGIENLQPRAFEVGVWRLRELLFALGRPPPEPMSRRYLHALALYAWGIWIYRLLLFLGIALLVYHFGFKLLGVALFVIEIVFFIARPVANELKAWHGLRREIVARRRGVLVGAAALCAIGACLVPWSTSIRVPALMDDRDTASVYPRRSAMVQAVHATNGARLPAGAPVVALIAPDLDHEIRMVQRRLRAAELRLERSVGSSEDRAQIIVLRQSFDALRAQLAGLERERAELVVRMPLAGALAELDHNLHAGRWVHRSDLLAVVVGGKVCRVRGYVREEDVARADVDARATFVADDVRSGALSVGRLRIATAAAAELDMPDLASHYGGGVATRLVARGRSEPRAMVPVVGEFLVTGDVDAPCNSMRTARGTLHIAGRPESLAARAWRQVLKVLVRESGF